MAVIEKPVSSKFKLGMTKTVEGELKNISKTFGNVKADATNAGVYAVAKGLGSLQQNPVAKISRMDEVELAESI